MSASFQTSEGTSSDCEQAGRTLCLGSIINPTGALMSDGKPTTRTESDSLGQKDIPGHVYYGIQTARAVENYPISGLRAHRTLIRAIAMVKEAAALANRELGLVDSKTANAIIDAAKE